MNILQEKPKSVLAGAAFIALLIGTLVGYNAAIPHEAVYVRNTNDGLVARPGYSLEFQRQMNKRPKLIKAAIEQCKKNDPDFPDNCGAMVCTHYLTTGHIVVSGHC